ncbi:MAG: DUF4383 domain-containing protein [Mycobacterium sp.]
MATTPKYMAVQGAALLIAGIFLVVGLGGFIPGVTTDYGLLTWAGHATGARLFGVFAVSGLHNVVHLAFGVVGLVLMRSYAAARWYLIGGGLAYLALWIYGLVVHQAAFMPINGADNGVHFALGAAMVLFGLTLAGQRDPTKRPSKTRNQPAAAKDQKRASDSAR